MNTKSKVYFKIKQKSNNNKEQEINTQMKKKP